MSKNYKKRLNILCLISFIIFFLGIISFILIIIFKSGWYIGIYFLSLMIYVLVEAWISDTYTWKINNTVWHKPYKRIIKNIIKK